MDAPFIYKACIHIYFISGFHTLRLWITPMSPTLCFMTYFSISWIMLIYVYLSTIQTILMYLFICKWKHMKIMNDDLIVRLSLICTIGITFWLTYVHKFWSQGKDNKQVSFKTFFCVFYNPVTRKCWYSKLKFQAMKKLYFFSVNSMVN